ncbi:MAG: type I-E CRISPR-associated protein Cse1/CasA [Anaerolineae bacterium]|nr:type I-E CRISPR-associated protein Cse1/CasA [Anaerolineae bacterium]
MTVSYDLLTQPWIPCVREDGAAAMLGLQAVLAEAHTLRELGGESPLVTAALYRLLLAVLHRVYDGPADPDAWGEIWDARRFDAARLSAYFDRWRDRFDLFHPERPFYQAADKRVKSKSVTALVHHVASGNNATLFDHHTDGGGLTLTSPEAARMLVAAQSFGMSGLSGLEQKFTSAPWVGAIIFFVLGKTLFETLALNMLEYSEAPALPCRRTAEDRPVWEQDDPFNPDRGQPYGYLDYLTWQNRRIRFFPEETTEGAIVREMTIAPALQLTDGLLDPQKHYRNDKKAGWLALRFNEDRALWRDSAAIFSARSSDYHPPLVLGWLSELVGENLLRKADQQRILALGMASDQAKVEFYRSEQWPLPLAYLDEQTGKALVEALQNITQMTEDVSGQLWGATRTLALLLLKPDADTQDKSAKIPPEVGNIMKQWDVKRRYWSRLEIPFRRALEAVPQDKDAALTEWQQTLRRVAWEAFNSIAEDLANDPRALKAFVKAQGQLAGGLKKVLPEDGAEAEEAQG